MQRYIFFTEIVLLLKVYLTIMFEAMFYTYIKNLISKKNTYFCDEIEKRTEIMDKKVSSDWL